MSAELFRLVGDVRITSQAFGELFRLIEEKFAPDSFVDSLGLILWQRLELLGEQLEEAIHQPSDLQGTHSNSVA